MTPAPTATENRLRLLLAHVIGVADRFQPQGSACVVCMNARAEADQYTPEVSTTR